MLVRKFVAVVQQFTGNKESYTLKDLEYHIPHLSYHDTWEQAHRRATYGADAFDEVRTKEVIELRDRFNIPEHVFNMIYNSEKAYPCFPQGSWQINITDGNSSYTIFSQVYYSSMIVEI